ncbi:hypothetical protein [Carnimonas bestiolae]|uniref:hypothetical protein n=1 Tax=Carnimonas bestiolae TaxID=3402172 RepID=UPI003F4AEA96
MLVWQSVVARQGLAQNREFSGLRRPRGVALSHGISHLIAAAHHATLNRLWSEVLEFTEPHALIVEFAIS